MEMDTTKNTIKKHGEVKQKKFPPTITRTEKAKLHNNMLHTQ